MADSGIVHQLIDLPTALLKNTANGVAHRSLICDIRCHALSAAKLSATCLAAAASRSTTKTTAPAPAKTRAIASPIPEPAPVTTANFPLNSKISATIL